MKIVYYVSGHGLGHATRVIAVVRELLLREHIVHLVSQAPAHVFLRDISDSFHLNLSIRCISDSPLDAGAIQSDPFTVCPLKTLEAAQIVFRNRAQLVQREAEWLREAQPHVVLVDVAPIPVAAAKEAHIPCFVVSNFTWDDIYAPFLTEGVTEMYQPIIDTMRNDYGGATGLLRLPGYCAMEWATKCPIVDIPLVVRQPTPDARTAVRREMGISDSAKVVLLTFGGQMGGGDFALTNSALPDSDWVCLVPHQGGWSNLPSQYKFTQEDDYMPDLIAASNVVICKIGFGTVSECFASNIPIVHVARTGFAEEPHLLNFLIQHGLPHMEMSLTDFHSCAWGNTLKEVLVKAQTQFHPQFQQHCQSDCQPQSQSQSQSHRSDCHPIPETQVHMTVTSHVASSTSVTKRTKKSTCVHCHHHSHSYTHNHSQIDSHAYIASHVHTSNPEQKSTSLFFSASSSSSSSSSSITTSSTHTADSHSHSEQKAVSHCKAESHTMRYEHSPAQPHSVSHAQAQSQSQTQAQAQTQTQAQTQKSNAPLCDLTGSAKIADYLEGLLCSPPQ